MKKLVIFEHDGGELANQLWNHLSIAAYAQEQKVSCENWSFYEYPDIFASPQANWLVRTFFEPRFRGYRKRKSAFKTRAWRKLYKALIVHPISFFCKDVLISTESAEAVRNAVYHLPPTQPASSHLQELEQSPGTGYIGNRGGAVFRNRVGILKHRETLVPLFAPTSAIEHRVRKEIHAAREKAKYVVGVHIRQGDYVTFKEGKYLIPQIRVREILDEFLKSRGWSAEETHFFITSDGKVDTSIFAGLNILLSTYDVGTDLFLLAACDVVVGSDSTLGHFATYLGNIPHIIMKKEEMDWGYYEGKDTYFPNKYLTIMAY